MLISKDTLDLFAEIIKSGRSRVNRSTVFRPIALLVLVSIAIGLLSSGCATEPAQSTGDGSTKPLTVAVGIVPLASFVTAVGGEQVKVVTMIPPGNSPANYQPSNIEMQALSDASLYLSLQTPTEKANILPKLIDFNQDIKLVDLQQAVGEVFPLRPVSQSILLGDPGTTKTQPAGTDQTIDHHVWLSPKRAIVIIERIAAELAALDSTHAPDFQANAKAYIAKLQALDESIRDSFAELKSRDFLIYHGSYTYFAEDYELNMISIELAGKEATASELKAIIDYARSNSIRVVFYQAEFDDTQARIVAQEINGITAKVEPLSGNYFAAMETIAQTLVQANG